MKAHTQIRATALVVLLAFVMLLPWCSAVVGQQDKKLDQTNAALSPAVYNVGGGSYKLSHYEFNSPESCNAAYQLLRSKYAEGTMAFPPYMQFLDVYFNTTKSAVASDAQKALAGFPGAWGDEDSVMTIPPRLSIPDAKDSNRATDTNKEVVFGGYKGLTGSGVIVAIIDSGVDYRNTAFQTPDGKSRLLYFWDVGAPGKSVFEARGVLDVNDPKLSRDRPCKKHQVSLSAGRTYVIDLISCVQNDPMWNIYDPQLVMQDGQGKEVAFNDDRDGRIRNSRIQYTPKTGGTFFLLASGYKGAGPYVLKVADASSLQNSPQFPNEAPMGVIYTQQEINDSLKGMAPFITGDLGDAKTGGHGTGCATVAAANDNNKKAMVGVAPKADLIIVRAADDTVDEDGLPHASLLNQICAHVLKLAKDHNKPVVLSCSFGTNSNVRPGRLIEDRQLSERFPLDKPGQAICISAGNANELKTQAHAVLDEKGTSQKITWVSPGLTNTIMLFFNTDDKKAIKLEGPYAQRITDSLVYNPITKGWQTDPTKAPKVGDKSADPPDTDYLIASSAGGKKITVDCFLNGTAQFIEPAFSRARTVGSPGRTANAITVGSYDWNNVFQDRVLATWSSGTGGAEYHNMVIGQLSSYSSRGPGIGDYQPGTSKPDVVSPGEYFTVHYPQQFLRAQKKQDVNFFDGTSAATPYTAGVIALMMEAKRDLTIAQIRDMFTKHVLPRSNSDAFVKDSFAQYGPLPNGAWGYGRLNRAAVEGILDDILAQSKK